VSKLRVLSLFAGIGGFDLGLERTGGFETVAFCEIEPFAVRVLNKHWPKVPVYGDVRELTGAKLAADGIGVDVICGGFPCQDISEAKQDALGLDGERSGLWREFARLIGEVRPRIVIVENVSALLGRGLGRVLGDLASLRYDAEWHCIQAADVGAQHIRDRVWIVAVADTQGERSLQRWGQQLAADGEGQRKVCQRFDQPEPLRMAHGIPDRTHRLKALGNAVVPQIPELIGRAILASLQTQAEAA
jgi:DNA (cytosine-5)-methyltransferase 1